MKRLFYLIITSIVFYSCSSLVIYHRYKPVLNENWTIQENGSFSHSLNKDSLIEIRYLPAKNFISVGPVFLPIIPLFIHSYKGNIYFFLHLSSNDSIQISKPLKVELITKNAEHSIESIEILPITRKLLRKLDFYHKFSNISKKYCCNHEYLYRFEVAKRDSLIYFKINTGKTNPNDDITVKYVLSKKSHYEPLWAPGVH